MSERSFRRPISSMPPQLDKPRSHRSWLAGAVIGAASLGMAREVDDHAQADRAAELSAVLRHEMHASEQSPFAFHEHTSWPQVGTFGAQFRGAVGFAREAQRYNGQGVLFEITILDRLVQVKNLDHYRQVSGVIRRAPSTEAAQAVYHGLLPREQRDTQVRLLRASAQGETPNDAVDRACANLLEEVSERTKALSVPTERSAGIGFPSHISRRLVTGRRSEFIDYPLTSLGQGEVIGSVDTNDSVSYVRDVRVQVRPVPETSPYSTYQATIEANWIHDTGRRWHHE